MTWAPLAGITLVAFGAILRFWSHDELRAVGVRYHHLVFNHTAPPAYTNKGPYRWLWHPCYVGSLLIFSGIGILCLGWGGIAIGFATLPFYEERIRRETMVRELSRERGVDGA